MAAVTEREAFLAVDEHLDLLLARLNVVGHGKLGRLRRVSFDDAMAVALMLRATFRDIGERAGVIYP